MKLINVCGARPNFMKIAALMAAYREFPNIQPILVHTGQHYDSSMSDLFFDQLQIPRPDINLEVGSGSHAEQTAQIMLRFEPVLQQIKPDAVVVVGDVNSTIACSLTACKMQIPVGHVEAGLRSFDRTMPEEINRLLTDAVSDRLFVSEPSGVENLKREGIDSSKIHFVGTVMIDTLLTHLELARRSDILQSLRLQPSRYGVITLHRPNNVDECAVLTGIYRAFDVIRQQLPLVFCMHPRTRKQTEQFSLWSMLADMKNMSVTPPLGYLEFLHLMSQAAVILTDSGGMQEEATILKVPCLTLRHNTERPITLTHGTSILAGNTTQSILQAYDRVDEIRRRTIQTPPLWDGRAAHRIAAILSKTS